ncbi:MAG: glucuronate isomerase, partial [Oscillospiraceae bacterium]|nr:glucuronate isomerase [Oscillospiraceae bacterium]
MKPFMDQNFLLATPTARTLFHDVAEGAPICDFHCHIPPKQIAENKPFRSITEAWLGGDHYKWRAMRIAGVPERRITGDASDLEKFEAYAAVVEKAIGNPLYHWTHLELQRYFGVEEPLTSRNATSIFERCNALLDDGMRPQELIARSNVRLLCTTDDPIDNLEWHERLSVRNDSGAAILPAFRPDKALNPVAADYAAYLENLKEASGDAIGSFADLKGALVKRIDYFHEHGCRLSDHALDIVSYAWADESKLDSILNDAASGKLVSQESLAQFRTALLKFLSEEYLRRGWTMQLHIGAIRNINAPMFAALGPDVGCDAMNDLPIAIPLAALLNIMSEDQPLPRTLLYSLNDKDNYTLNVIAGALQRDGRASHVAMGP